MNKFFLLFTFITITNCILNNSFAQGYGDSPLTWEVPEGGQINRGINQGLLTTNDANLSEDDINTVLWFTDYDMNGDGKVDLVMTGILDQESTKTFRRNDGKQYWKVFLNTGTGFNKDAIEWSLPKGGHTISDINLGFYLLNKTTSIGNSTGSQYWSLLDVDGDKKRDLVVTGERNSDGITKSFGETSRHWKVYKNTGAGFTETPITWNVPTNAFPYEGGDYGFFNTLYTPYSFGTVSGIKAWNTLDMNNDGKPDLIVTGELDTTYTLRPYNKADPYWKVYLNTGTGFATSFIEWKVPKEGGAIISDQLVGFNGTSSLASNPANQANSEIWDLIDLTGDSKLDVVVFCKMGKSVGTVFGDTQKYWKVYANTGSGFSRTFSIWHLPVGGQTTSTFFQGFSWWYDVTDNYNDTGSQNWQTIDFNGDNLKDLIIYSEKNETYTSAFGESNNQIKVFLNDGSQFSSDPILWELPSGGRISNNINMGFNNVSYWGGYTDVDLGSNFWSSFDINGDTKPDFIVTAEYDTDTIGVFRKDFPYWKVYLNDIVDGIDNISSLNDVIKIYPNPMNNELTISLKEIKETTTVSIISFSGQQISEHQITSIQTKINTNDLMPGIYFIKTNNPSIKPIKIIKL